MTKGVMLSQGDLLSLKQGVHKQLQQLDVNAVAAANSVALLKEVDKVKGRMEAACSTLKVCWSTFKLHTTLPVHHLCLDDCLACSPASQQYRRQSV